MIEWAATRTRGRLAGGVGNVREGTRDIAEGFWNVQHACRTRMGSNL